MYIAAVLASLAFGWAALLVWRRSQTQVQLPLPPGPNPLPILGNLFDIPTSKEWLTYHEWHARYGDVVSVEALGQHIIVLGSMQAVTDLMERRSAIYSDRIQLVMLHDLMGFHWNFSLMPYGERWRQRRKMLHAHVQSSVVSQYQPIQIRAARELAHELLTVLPSPETLPALVRAHVGAEIVKVTYGIEVGKSEAARQKYIDVAEQAVAGFVKGASPGHFMVDYFPFLRYLPTWAPGSGFLHYAQEVVNVHTRLRNEPAQVVEDEIAAGTAPPSILRSMLQDFDSNEQETKNLIKDVGGIVYMAGADTTVSTILTFLLAMVLHPEVQKKGQAEVDAAVDLERLPEFMDFDRMPYVNAIILECLRWIPVLPMSVPHATTREDDYRGWHIPKGAIVIGNSWELLHDPVVYPSPEEFRPERFLRKGTNGLEIDPTVRDPRSAAFGYGRRVCSGRHLVEQDLLATFATVLSTVDVLKAVDAEGQEITPIVDATSGGLISQPKPFAYRVSPRSPQVTELLERSLVPEF